MKLLGRILLGILALAIAVIVFGLWQAARARDADHAFHAAIPKTLVLRSETFEAGGVIPAAFTCKGSGSSPEISWQAAPANTQSFVLILTDWDVPSPNFRLFAFTHWILYDVPRTLQEIKAAVAPADLSRAKVEYGHNSSGEAAFTPPCPPLGTHSYVFSVYALDTPELHPASRDKQAILDAMTGHVLAYGQLVGHFGR